MLLSNFGMRTKVSERALYASKVIAFEKVGSSFNRTRPKISEDAAEAFSAIVFDNMN